MAAEAAPKSFWNKHGTLVVVGAVAATLGVAYWYTRKKRAIERGKLDDVMSTTTPISQLRVMTQREADETENELIEAQNKGDFASQVQLLDMLAAFHGQNGDLHNCAQYLKREVDALVTWKGTRNVPEVTERLFHLGVVYVQTRQIDRAIEIFKDLEVVENALGVAVHSAYLPMAAAYLELDQLKEAETYYTKCRNELHASGAEMELTAAVDGLAVCQMRLGKDLAAVRQLFEESMAIKKKHKGENSVEVSEAYANLSGFFHANNQMPEAMVALQKSTDILVTLFGDDHPQLGTNLNNLAVMKLETGDVQGAIRMLEECKRVFSKNLGPNHPAVEELATTIASITPAATQS